MRYLLLQTFLLLLASYFFGAFLGCVAKRATVGRRRGVSARTPVPVIIPATVPATAPAPAVARSVQPPPVAINAPPPIAPVVPQVAARAIKPARPHIEYGQRPEPYPVPKLADPKRFERALMGPEPNEGMPRVAIVEIRPKVLPSPTEPVPSRMPAPVARTEAPEATVPPSSDVVETAHAEPQRPRDAVTAASAAAVAAAKAAAAVLAATRSIAGSGRAAAEDDVDGKADTPKKSKADSAENAGKKADTAEPAKEEAQDGDDLQRIRAIDAETEKKLKDLGVLYFEHIAAWTPSDVKRMSQTLGMPGRIDREQWVEQAQILAKGGETYYSRNRRAAQKADEPEPKEANSKTETEAETETETETKIEPQLSESNDTPPSPSDDEDETEPSSTKESVEEIDVDARPTERLGVAGLMRGRSIAELASAAATAVAAASASVTRGNRPIEPISPLSKVDPNISMPARLTDAIRERAASVATEFDDEDVEGAKFGTVDADDGPANDLKRIRGIGVLIEKRLNAMGIRHYKQIANWTSGDIDRVSHVLEFGTRIERENWVQQARILSNGGQTEFSRRVDRGEFDTSRET